MKVFALFCLLMLGSRAQFTGRLHGVNYSLRIGPDWTFGADRCKSRDRIVSELTTLKFDMTDNVRVFTMTDCDTAGTMLELTQDVDMGLWLGIWVGPNGTVFDDERARFLQLLETHSFANVLGIHVSSEAIYREEITPEEAMNLHSTIKDDLAAAGLQDIPVTISDIIDTNIEFPELITVDPNVVTFNMFPFWERTVDINGAAEYMDSRIQRIEQLAEGRQIIITETGWADGGVNDDSNEANPASQAKWFRDFVCLAHERGWQYFWFTSFDSDWRRVNEEAPDDVEGRFGLYDEQGVIKDHIRNLFIDCFEPRQDVSFFEFLETPGPDGRLSTANPTPFGTNSDPTPVPSFAPVTSGPTISSNQVFIADTFTVAPTAEPISVGFTGPPTTIDPFVQITPSPVISSAINIGFTPSPSVDIFAPTNTEVKDSRCSANVLCSVRGLEGECCPTPEGVDLDCCGTFVIETCFNNPTCDTLGLAGACCPTNDKVRFLDCCESVPDICLGDDNSDCVVISALEYKAELEAQQQSSSVRLAAGFAASLALVLTFGL